MANPLLSLAVKGTYKLTRKALEKMISTGYLHYILNKYGDMGVVRLYEYTPKKTGKTALSWTYKVNVGKTHSSIEWWNTNENEGVPIALVIQYGHGMPNGGYVKGIDYINPALQPIFEAMADDVWKEVTNV